MAGEYDRFRHQEAGFNLIYELPFRYPIWQLRFHPADDLIAVECRSAEVLETIFSAFRGTDGEFLLSDYTVADSWWTGLEAIDSGLLYLHGMEAGGLGQHRGITAIGLADGFTRWQRPDCRFYGITANELVAVPVGSEVLSWRSLNKNTGAETGKIWEGASVQTALASYRDSQFQEIRQPVQHAADTVYFADLASFIQNNLAVEPQLAIDYLETDTYFGLGFYVADAEELFDYWVAVYALEGTLWLQKNLGTELSGIGTDNFFIFKDRLILIQNKTTLLGYAVY
jgi:hypothetical protein